MAASPDPVLTNFMRKKYIHYFKTEQEYNDKRENDYYEPWVGYTESNNSVSYNKFNAPV